jgi:hypothetical protein
MKTFMLAVVICYKINFELLRKSPRQTDKKNNCYDGEKYKKLANILSGDENL